MFVDKAQVGVKTDNDFVAILKAAKAVIDQPAHWITGHYCRGIDESGYLIINNPEKGVQFCALGALWKTLGGTSFTYIMKKVLELPAGVFLHVAARELGFTTVVMLNDNAGHAVVMQMFDNAIAEAEKL